MKQNRGVLLIVLSGVLLAGVSVFGQASSPNYSLTAGSTIGGGGGCSSTSATLVGGVAGTTAGVSQSSSYTLVGGVAATLFGPGSQTGVHNQSDDENLPYQFTLEQNYPNPFNPKTRIDYSLAEPSDVTLTVYDILGRVVAALVDQNQTPGEYTVDWDGTTAGGEPVASGVYFYRLSAGEFVRTRKMVLLR